MSNSKCRIAARQLLCFAKYRAWLAELFKFALAFEFDLENPQQQQFDDVFDPLDRCSGGPQLVVQGLEDCIGLAVGIMNCRSTHTIKPLSYNDWSHLYSFLVF